MNTALQEYIQAQILPQYAAYDKAHGPEHVRSVIQNSMELAAPLGVDMDMVYAIAAFHDLGIRFGREDHEKTSAALFMADETMPRWFTDEQRQIMKEAIEDHRASSAREPRSLYGRIVSEADRDIDPERIVRRCMEYGRAQHPGLGPDQLVERAARHIEEKYGENGYLHLWLPCPRNQQGLDTLRRWLKSGEIRAACRRYL